MFYSEAMMIENQETNKIKTGQSSVKTLKMLALKSSPLA